MEGVPGPSDLAIIGNFNVTIPQDQNITALAVALHGGSIKGEGSLTIAGTFTVSRGTVSLPNLTIAASGTLLLVNEEDIPLGGTVTNNGTTRLIGRAGITGIPEGSGANATQVSGTQSVSLDFFHDRIVAALKNLGDLILGRRTGGKREVKPAPQPFPEVPRTVLLVIENAGRLLGQDGAGAISDNGAGLIGQDGAGVISTDGAGIISSDGASIISSDGASIISSDGASVVAGGGGNIGAGRGSNAAPGITNKALSEQNVAAATGTGAFRQTGGTTNLRGIRIIGPVILNGGVLDGAGVIEGDLTNDGGFIAPGNSAGAIGVTGNFTQTAKGSLLLEVGGINSYIPQFDQLKIGGTAALDGKLTVRTINGFTPNPNLPLVPLSYASATGGFASTSGNVQLDLRDTGAAVAVAGANPPLPSLRNISTRGVTLTGDKVMIGGFIVTGPSGSTKKVLVRGLGPTLTKYGVPNALSDPALSLYKPGGAWRITRTGNKRPMPARFRPICDQKIGRNPPS